MNDKQNKINNSNYYDSMRLGKFEFKAMNNIFRQFIQKHFEFEIFKKFLKRYSIDLENEIIIDAGCGSGYSSELIMKQFNPKKIIAFDIMPEQINLAKNRSVNVDFYIGDVTKIDVKEQDAKAVFVFGVIHHVPEWKKAIKEFARILKQGGVVLIEEPLHIPMYTWNEFENEFDKNGLTLLNRRNLIFNYFRSYIFKKI